MKSGFAHALLLGVPLLTVEGCLTAPQAGALPVEDAPVPMPQETRADLLLAYGPPDFVLEGERIMAWRLQLHRGQIRPWIRPPPMAAFRTITLRFESQAYERCFQLVVVFDGQGRVQHRSWFDTSEW